MYGNVSQNYRSVTFNDIRVVNPSFQVDENISDEKGFTADLGVRGRWKRALSYDVSVFSLLYDDRLGEVLRSENNAVVRFRGNIGTAFILGVETFFDWNIKQTFFDEASSWRFNLFSNVAYTTSEYIESEEVGVEGNEVEFIPKLNIKTGLKTGYKNALLGVQFTYLSSQFTDATNAAQDVSDNQRGIEGSIPAYDIVDVFASYRWRNFSIETGIDNALNKSYFTRRATGYPGPGIIPAPPRTWYAGLQITW